MHAGMSVLRCFLLVPAHTWVLGPGRVCAQVLPVPGHWGQRGDGGSSLMLDECPQEGQLPLPAGEKLKPQGETPLQPPSKSR